MPVRLTARDFALPATFAMRSNFGGLGRGLASRLKMNPEAPEFQQVENRHIDTMLAHRCIPGSLGRIWPDWTPEKGLDDSRSGERLRRMVEDRHVNSLNLPFGFRQEPDKCRAYLRDLAAYLRRKGWLDLAYVYLRDEPNNAEEYETVRQEERLLHEADPGIQRMCTEQTRGSNPAWGTLTGAVDIWCPLWCLYDEPTARERQKQGEEIRSYTSLCQGGVKPPFWQIDFAPVAFRAPFWTSWRYGIKGFLYRSRLPRGHLWVADSLAGQGCLHSGAGEE